MTKLNSFMLLILCRIVVAESQVITNQLLFYYLSAEILIRFTVCLINFVFVLLHYSSFWIQRLILAWSAVWPLRRIVATKKNRQSLVKILILNITEFSLDFRYKHIIMLNVILRNNTFFIIHALIFYLLF